jgi:hypothetical protein
LKANYEPDELGRYCYWTDHKPHWMRETQSMEQVFLDDNLEGATYLTLPQEDLVPALAALFPNPLHPDLTDD